MPSALQLEGFTPVLDVMLRRYGATRALVYGKVWRYCQMSEHVCMASYRRLAEELHLSRRTVIRHVGALAADGFLEDLTPDENSAPHKYRVTDKVRFVSRMDVVLDEGVTECHSPSEAPGEGVTECHSGGDTASLGGDTASPKDTIKIPARHISQTADGLMPTDPPVLETQAESKPKRARSDRSGASPAQRAHRELFRVLADVCHVDAGLKTMQGLLNRTAGELRQAGYDADTIRRLFGANGIYWRKHWKGKKRQPPGPVDVIQSIRYLREQEAGPGAASAHPLDLERITRESIASLGVT